MNIHIDDDELTFEEDAGTDSVADDGDEVSKASAASAPASAAEAAETQSPVAPSQPEPKAPEETKIAHAPAKRSRTGMAVAAGFAICIVASLTSAVQAWRAASAVAHGAAGEADTALQAKLNNIEKLLEQQRNTLDGMTTAKTAPAAPGDNNQINALAAAVRANQEMTERLPAMIMQNVDARLAGARPVAKAETRTGRPAPVKKAAARKAEPARVQPKPAATTANAALPVKALEPVSTEPPKRPAGEAIRYP